MIIQVDSNMGGSWLLKDVNQHWWVSQFLESQVHFMTVNLGKHRQCLTFLFISGFSFLEFISRKDFLPGKDYF